MVPVGAGSAGPGLAFPVEAVDPAMVPDFVPRAPKMLLMPSTPRAPRPPVSMFRRVTVFP